MNDLALRNDVTRYYHREIQLVAGRVNRRRISESTALEDLEISDMSDFSD